MSSRVVAGIVCALLSVFAPQNLGAQTFGSVFDAPSVQSPVLVVELERLFSDSAFGKRVSAEIEAEGAAIAAENRRIEAELTAEEKEITEQRPTLGNEAFRKVADAFDEKVQTIRRQQDAKVRVFGQRGEEERRKFLVAAQPILQDLMREAGAAVMLDRRAVFLASQAVDVTDEAISRINNVLGDGATPPDSDP